MLASSSAFGLSTLALSGFLRIVTHPRVFDPPSPLGEGLRFCDFLIGQPHVMILSPGTRHWSIFEQLCRDANAKGNLVPDAYFAALAIEHGAEWITLDRDFARFPGLKWRLPLS
jgi:toxin-antitoxin system PIN domain toxin